MHSLPTRLSWGECLEFRKISNWKLFLLQIFAQKLVTRAAFESMCVEAKPSVLSYLKVHEEFSHSSIFFIHLKRNVIPNLRLIGWLGA